jgi:hypothetical protein
LLESNEYILKSIFDWFYSSTLFIDEIEIGWLAFVIGNVTNVAEPTQ